MFDDADLDAALLKLEKALTVFATVLYDRQPVAGSTGVADRVRQQLAERLTNVNVGPASDSTSDMGLMIEQANVGAREPDG